MNIAKTGTAVVRFELDDADWASDEREREIGVGVVGTGTIRIRERSDGTLAIIISGLHREHLEASVPAPRDESKELVAQVSWTPTTAELLLNGTFAKRWTVPS